MDDRTTDPPAGDAPPQPPVPRTGEDGKPVYDQDFFLALARCGKEVWNKWCETNSDASVTFAGVDFRKDENGVDFSGFEFGGFADFSGCRFRVGVLASRRLRRTFRPGTASFSGATFGYRADLSGATFGDGADLSGATFGDYPNLSGTTFGDEADLSGATFGDKANLSGAAFRYSADLSGATFGDRANLSDATFGDGASFSGATFGDGTSFSGATFDAVDFRAQTVEQWTEARTRLITRSQAMQRWPEERKAEFTTLHPYATRPGEPHVFPDIDFTNVRFLEFANFSGRAFKGRCDLTGARFRQPPSFDACEGLHRLDLYGARIGFVGRVAGWTADSDVANRLRRLREIANDTNDHDLERDLYIEERKAERGIFLSRRSRLLRERCVEAASAGNAPRVRIRNAWGALLSVASLLAHCLWIVVMAIFWAFADYGRSFIRPLAALAFSVPLLWWAYTSVLMPPTNPTKLADFRRAVWAFAISSAVPFVGALTLERDVKLTLLCRDQPIDKEHARPTEPLCVPIPGRRFQLLALGQSIFSALCIFFAGLALRNYFKLR